MNTRQLMKFDGIPIKQVGNINPKIKRFSILVRVDSLKSLKAGLSSCEEFTNMFFVS